MAIIESTRPTPRFQLRTERHARSAIILAAEAHDAWRLLAQVLRAQGREEEAREADKSGGSSEPG